MKNEKSSIKATKKQRRKRITHEVQKYYNIVSSPKMIKHVKLQQCEQPIWDRTVQTTRKQPISEQRDQG